MPKPASKPRTKRKHVVESQRRVKERQEHQVPAFVPKDLVPEFKFYPSTKVMVFPGQYARALVNDLPDTLASYFKDIPPHLLGTHWPSLMDLQLHTGEPGMVAMVFNSIKDYTQYDPEVWYVFSLAELGAAPRDSERRRFAFAVAQMCDHVLHGSVVYRDAQLLHQLRERMGQCLALPMVEESEDNANLLLILGAGKMQFAPVPLTQYQHGLCLKWFQMLQSPEVNTHMRWFTSLLLSRCLDFLGLDVTSAGASGAVAN
jgi:hypothetical protein